MLALQPAEVASARACGRLDGANHLRVQYICRGQSSSTEDGASVAVPSHSGTVACLPNTVWLLVMHSTDT